MTQVFTTLPLAEIVNRCESAAIPFSPIARPEDLFEDPHLNEGDSLVKVELPDGRRTKLPRLPLAIDGQRPDLRLEAPGVGENTRDVLHALSYNDVDIESLRDAGIIAILSDDDRNADTK